ncbi:MAG: formylmethanofuran dehydrogenase subunit B [Candidatus Methanomethylicota archaeon]|uniref:Formylmethanofuran dehydrogenase subunit B n=1 Tax=Thermoproteota archaeon TaxID=2056631 RepID=A0A497F7A1_9CREN|nr:MAG: formylmethanofuran dehydrogenase subunit B [Candidatus Verstraetearchaeota archaeon]
MPTFKGIRAELKVTDKAPPTQRELIITNFGIEAPSVEFEEIETQKPSGEKVYTSVICSFCGCLCDDLEVKVSNGRIVEVKRACPLGRSKIAHYLENRVLKPMIKIDGKFVETSLENAIKKTAEILVNASYPLIYGWSSTSTEAIRLGVELAELLGAALDNTSVMCHGPTILGVQEVGTVAATLGQIRNHADLMIYWGCNPFHAHPKHPARYSAMAKGAYVKTRKERKIIVIDVRETPTARIADLFIKVKPGGDYELIKALRMAINDLDIEVDEVSGVPTEKIYELSDIMRSAKFGALFFGLGVTMTKGKGRNIEEVIKLVQELNSWTKFVLMPMRGHYNVVGANMATLWATGFPFAVDFSRGYPRHNPGVTSATDLLLNGDVDAALIVASDPVAHFPAQAVKNLTKIPVITIDPKWNLTSLISQIVIPAAIVGVECEGSAYRMDKVPLRLKKLVDPPPGVPSDEEIMKMLIREIKKLKGVSA